MIYFGCMVNVIEKVIQIFEQCKKIEDMAFSFLVKLKNKKNIQKTEIVKSEIKEKEIVNQQKVHCTENLKKYAKQVADIIRKYHGKEDSSFIFGLSGKWGSGKTNFLNILKPELEDASNDKHFIVLTISPWKFGSEKTTFLRNFLRELNTKAEKISADDYLQRTFNKNIFLKAFTFIQFRVKNRKIDLKNLDNDITKPTIDKDFKFILLLGLIFLFLIYKMLVQAKFVTWEQVLQLNKSFGIVKNYVVYLLPIITIPILLSIMNINKQSKQISALDGFEDFYKKILKKFSNRNLIIFVDDLDRVNPNIARQTLDILRTFFENKDVSFVITGDHSILEENIGRQILGSKGKTENYYEKGREYLKKIFNIYWPLPIPTDQEFKNFLELKINSEYKNEIEEIFKEKKDRYILIKWLLKYFNKNYRNVIRFIETIIFNFSLINTQMESADEDLKAQLQDIYNYPLLFIRVLMIQELASPLYTKYLETPSTIIKIEEDLGKTDSVFKETVDKLSISDLQKKFINEFIYELPRFYDPVKGVEVHSIEPFIYIASSSDFSNIRGPNANDFIGYIKNNDGNNIENALQVSGETRVKEYTTIFKTHLNSLIGGDVTELSRVILLVLNSLKNINAENKIHQSFLDLFSDISFDINSQPLEERKAILIKFMEWLDNISDGFNINELIDKFNIITQAQIDQVEQIVNGITKIGNFSSKLICKWIGNNVIYPTYKNKILDIFLKTIDSLREIDINNYLGEHPEFLSDFISDPEGEIGTKIWEIVEKSKDSEFNQKISDEICQNIKNGNIKICDWVFDHNKEVEKSFPEINIKDNFIEFINNQLQSPDNFVNNIVSYEKISSLFLSDIWGRILTIGNLYLMPVLNQIISKGVTFLIPSENTAKLIEKRIFDYSFSLITEQEQTDSINLLTKSMLWNNLSDLSYKKALIAKSRKNSIKLILSPRITSILQSWRNQSNI